MKPRNLGQAFIRGLLLFGAGLAVGFLTAPKTGRGTRAWLGQKADHLQNVGLRLTDRLRARARYEEGRMTGAMHKVRQLALAPSEEEATRYVDDDVITQRVRTRIGENPQTWHLPRINIDTADRVITLRGRVDSDAQKQALEEIAAADPDVDSVINKTTVARRQAAS